MYRKLLNNKESGMGIAFPKKTFNQILTIKYMDGSHEFTIMGDLRDQDDYTHLELLLITLKEELAPKEYLNIYINLIDIEDNSIILLYRIIQKLILSSSKGQDINLYWNTEGDAEMMKIATEIENRMSWQIFSTRQL